jgi:predicted component of type VI protein secretion system
LKQVLETAIYGTALDLLRSDPVRRLEASWRGLRMLLAACPASSDLDVEVLDVASGDLIETLRSRPASDGFDGPDAVFVIDPVEAFDVLGELADVAEEMLAPCVAHIGPELLGATTVSQLAERVSRGEPLPQEWSELRNLGPARWLSAVVNPMALYSEGAGAFKRFAFGSPVWAVATMLSTSYRAQGAVAGIVGRGGAIEAPAAWTIASGSGAGSRAPTEAFLALAAQKELATQGVIALGSTRDADRVVLAAAPMVGGDLPLPAQLLTGRIVRFSRWTGRQIDPTLPPDEVSALFQQAAEVFLSPGMAGAAAVGAQVRGEGPNRVLRVAARVAPTRALVPLSIEFDLPM